MNLRSYKGIQPRVAETAYVDSTAVVVGDVEIGEDASIWPCVVIRGDVHHVRIGARTNVQDGAVLHVAHQGPYSPGYPLLIGADVTIGHSAVVHACSVGDGCLIGMNATVLNGAVIGSNSLVAAGALVLEGTVIPPRSLVAGVPAKVRRELTDDEVAGLYGNSARYVPRAKRYRAAGI